MNEIQIAINILQSHDFLEEAEKLTEMAKVCNCIDCKEYRQEETYNKSTASDGEIQCGFNSVGAADMLWKETFHKP